MTKNNEEELVSSDYKYGFKTETKSVLDSGKGLSRDVVEFISKAKGEPDWMREFRLKSYDAFLKLKNPSWGPDLMIIHIILNQRINKAIPGRKFLQKLRKPSKN